jgi:hypothetical protein
MDRTGTLRLQSAIECRDVLSCLLQMRASAEGMRGLAHCRLPEVIAQTRRMLRKRDVNAVQMKEMCACGQCEK